MTPEEWARSILDTTYRVCMDTDCTEGVCSTGCHVLAGSIATALREAEARGLERAAEIAEGCTDTAGSVAEYIAAAIRAEKERTP